jgi:hypothetical protein
MDLWMFFVVFLFCFCTQPKIVLAGESKLLHILFYRILYSVKRSNVLQLISLKIQPNIKSLFGTITLKSEQECQVLQNNPIGDWNNPGHTIFYFN